MITLHNFGSNFGLPDPSPFVLKTEVQLKMTGLAYQRQTGGLPTAPKGKLPYIDDEGIRIADSVFIRAYLEQTYGIDLDAGLDPGQRALAWTVERMVEDHLYWAMVHERWLIDDNFAKGPSHFFDDAPEPMREQIRATVRNEVRQGLMRQGLARHSVEEIGDIASRSFAAVSQLLGDKPYLTGETPCGADASLFGLLAGVTSPLFEGVVRDACLAHQNLIAYRDRMMARYYPDFA